MTKQKISKDREIEILVDEIKLQNNRIAHRDGYIEGLKFAIEELTKT